MTPLEARIRANLQDVDKTKQQASGEIAAAIVELVNPFYAGMETTTRNRAVDDIADAILTLL